MCKNAVCPAASSAALAINDIAGVTSALVSTVVAAITAAVRDDMNFFIFMFLMHPFFSFFDKDSVSCGRCCRMYAQKHCTFVPENLRSSCGPPFPLPICKVFRMLTHASAFHRSCGNPLKISYVSAF